MIEVRSAHCRRGSPPGEAFDLAPPGAGRGAGRGAALRLAQTGEFARKLLAITSLLTVMAAGSAAHACKEPPQSLLPGVHEWLRKARASGHPLAGRVYAGQGLMRPQRAKGCRDVDPLFIVAELAAAGRLTERQPRNHALVILGEVHDNAWHHELRADILRRASAMRSASADEARRGPAAVFEHIRSDQQAALDLFSELSRKGQHLDRPAEFFRFLKWDQSGWPDKALFQPLFRAAITGRLPILPGDPPRETIRGVAKQGLAATLPGDDIARMKLDQPLPPDQADAQLGELEISHCGLMPKAAFTTMAEAQRYRDAHLAEATLKAAEQHDGAILLTGNGHARSDRGVPLHLARMAPGKPVLTILLIEVEAGKTNPTVYIPRFASGRPAADYIVFTPRVERKDPCIEMRERFKARN